MGLFTSKPARVVVSPAAPGHGLKLRRLGAGEVAVTIAHLAAPPSALPARSTNLAAPGGGAMTVEHLLSALVGLGITDAVIELDGPEIPIMDGSASPLVEAILRAGIVEGARGLEPLRLRREVTVSRRNARMTARPREGACLYRYELDYGPGAPIAAQSAEWDSGGAEASAVYARGIAPARTFCLEEEARAMRSAGLFTGLAPGDMLVFGERGPIDNTLRFENEPARHKLLDLIGDLALVGRPLNAEIVAHRSGHALNHELARAIVAAI